MSEPTPKDVLEAGAKALFGPVQELFLKLTGPAAEEYGLMWSDSVKMRRTKRLVKGLARTKKFLAEAGFDPQAVPDKLLLPIFEGMSVEDDEGLQEMWAGLLANAALATNADQVRPGFIAILKQMAPDEAALLNWIHRHTDTDPKLQIVDVGIYQIADAYVDLGFPRSRLAISLGGLEASRLIGGHNKLSIEETSAYPNRMVTPAVYQDGTMSYSISERGRAFIEVCRPPKPKS